MLERIIGVITFKRSTYEEIEKNSSLLPMAAVVVLIASVASAIGGLTVTSSLGSNVIAHTAWSVVGWLLISAILFVVGAKVFGGRAGFSEILRMVGFAYAPLTITILGRLAFVAVTLGFLAWAIAFAALIWFFGTLFVAAQEALDLSVPRTAVVVIIAFFVYLIGLGVLLQWTG